MKITVSKDRRQSMQDFIKQFKVGDRVCRKEFESYLNVEEYQVQLGVIQEVVGEKARVEWSKLSQFKPKETTIALKSLVLVLEVRSSTGNL